MGKIDSRKTINIQKHQISRTLLQFLLQIQTKLVLVPKTGQGIVEVSEIFFGYTTHHQIGLIVIILDHSTVAVDPNLFAFAIDPAVIQIVGILFAGGDVCKTGGDSGSVGRMDNPQHFRGVVGFAAVFADIVVFVNITEKPTLILRNVPNEKVIIRGAVDGFDEFECGFKATICFQKIIR